MSTIVHTNVVNVYYSEQIMSLSVAVARQDLALQSEVRYLQTQPRKIKQSEYCNCLLNRLFDTCRIRVGTVVFLNSRVNAHTITE